MSHGGNGKLEQRIEMQLWLTVEIWKENWNKLSALVT
jgi:hypothetical protein